jgi:FtsZ-interacting cell division protein ZipA
MEQPKQEKKKREKETKSEDGYESFDEVDEDEIIKETEQRRTVTAPRAKKLGPNERMKLYKDFTQGKLQRDRPKIVVPENFFTKKQNKKANEAPKQQEQQQRGKKRKLEETTTSNDKGQGSGFVKGDGMVGDWAKLLRNPFQFRNKNKNADNELTKMMLSSTSEFDSGLAPAQKKRRS